MRWTAAGLVGVVLLLSSYVTSWALVPHVLQRGWLTGATADWLYGRVFAPLEVYRVGTLPGANGLNAYYHWVNADEEELYVEDAPQ
jgi:hypothetical protein